MTPEQWAFARPHVEAALACADGTHTPEDVLQGYIDGRFLIWLGERSVVVTHFEVFPRMKSLNVWLCGGDWSEIAQATWPHVQALARAAGCRRVTGHGGDRTAWDRICARLGFKPKWRTYSKELTDGQR